MAYSKIQSYLLVNSSFTRILACAFLDLNRTAVLVSRSHKKKHALRQSYFCYHFNHSRFFPMVNYYFHDLLPMIWAYSFWLQMRGAYSWLFCGFSLFFELPLFIKATQAVITQVNPSSVSLNDHLKTHRGPLFRSQEGLDGHSKYSLYHTSWIIHKHW